MTCLPALRSGTCLATLTAALLATHVWATPLRGQEDVPTRVAPASPFAPDTVLSPPGGPRIVLLTSPGEGVAALRLTVPLREGRAEAGAGLLLRELALGRMRALARPVGARVSAARTPWGLAYSVEGAAADFEYLAYLLREAVAPPNGGDPGFQDLRARLASLALESWETPRGRVAADLRGQAAPGLPPVEGTPGAVLALDAARLREVWLRSHQPSGMTLVVSAPMVPEVVLAATRALGAPEASAAPPLDGAPRPEPRRPAPQTLRGWYGEAWPAGEPGDHHGAVVALLVSDHLERSGARGYELTVELWELPGQWVLTVTGASYAREAQAMRRAVSGALAGARATVDDRSVSEAVARLRSDRMMQSRTPAGLVSVVGRALEATGDPWSAVAATEALARVDGASVRRFMDEMARRGPFTAQVRP